MGTLSKRTIVLAEIGRRLNSVKALSMFECEASADFLNHGSWAMLAILQTTRQAPFGITLHGNNVELLRRQIRVIFSNSGTSTRMRIRHIHLRALQQACSCSVHHLPKVMVVRHRKTFCASAFSFRIRLAHGASSSVEYK